MNWRQTPCATSCKTSASKGGPDPSVEAIGIDMSKLDHNVTQKKLELASGGRNGTQKNRNPSPKRVDGPWFRAGVARSARARVVPPVRVRAETEPAARSPGSARRKKATQRRVISVLQEYGTTGNTLGETPLQNVAWGWVHRFCILLTAP